MFIQTTILILQKQEIIFLKKSEHDNAIHPVHPRLRLYVLCAAEAGEILVELVENIFN